MSNSEKLHTKTFCLDKELIDWLSSEYGRNSHALVRQLLWEYKDKNG